MTIILNDDLNPVLPQSEEVVLKKNEGSFLGKAIRLAGRATEGACLGSAALVAGTVSGHVVGKTLNGFVLVEVVPLVVHALQRYILPYVANTSFGGGLATASTYYLTGLTAPYILMGTQLVGGYIGAQAGYWATKGVIALGKRMLSYVTRVANWVYQSLFGNAQAKPEVPKVVEDAKIRSSKKIIDTKKRSKETEDLKKPKMKIELPKRPFEFEDLETLKKMGYTVRLFDIKV